MKTILPGEIKTVKAAKQYLTDLYNNAETFMHLMDSAERPALIRLMDQCHKYIDVSDYFMKLDKRQERQAKDNIKNRKI